MKVNYSLSLESIEEMNGDIYDANCIVTISANNDDAPESITDLMIYASVDFLADCDEGGFSLRADVGAFQVYDSNEKGICPADSSTPSKAKTLKNFSKVTEIGTSQKLGSG
jgi:hypothetical protein